MPLSSARGVRVTVIVPTYNRAHVVTHAIDSALGQRDAEMSVIVVDDGSIDATAATLAAYASDARVQVVTHPSNRGVTAAKNSGLVSVPVETDWVGILDSDDVLAPDAIRTLVAAVEGRWDHYSQVIGWCEDAQSGAPTGQMTHCSGEVHYEDALCGRFVGEFWHLARRDLVASVRFDERASGGEGALWWHLLRTQPAWLVGEVVRRYDRSGADRVGIIRYTPLAASGRMWAYRAVLDSVGADMLDVCPRRYGVLMGEMAKWSALAGDRPTARDGAWKALRHAPSRRSLLLVLLAWAPAWLVRQAASASRARWVLGAARRVAAAPHRTRA